MRKEIKLARLLFISAFILGLFFNHLLADVKKEEQSSKSQTSEKTKASDEMGKILENYFAMRHLLAQDQFDQVALHNKEISERLNKLIQALEKIKAASDSLKATDLEKAREGFGPLSQALLDYVKGFGFSGKAFGFYCGMVKQSWLQQTDQIGNPYYGSQMYKCGKMTGMVVNGKYVEK